MPQLRPLFRIFDAAMHDEISDAVNGELRRDTYNKIVERTLELCEKEPLRSLGAPYHPELRLCALAREIIALDYLRGTDSLYSRFHREAMMPYAHIAQVMLLPNVDDYAESIIETYREHGMDAVLALYKNIQ